MVFFLRHDSVSDSIKKRFASINHLTIDSFFYLLENSGQIFSPHFYWRNYEKLKIVYYRESYVMRTHACTHTHMQPHWIVLEVFSSSLVRAMRWVYAHMNKSVAILQLYTSVNNAHSNIHIMATVFVRFHVCECVCVCSRVQQKRRCSAGSIRFCECVLCVLYWCAPWAMSSIPRERGRSTLSNRKDMYISVCGKKFCFVTGVAVAACARKCAKPHFLKYAYIGLMQHWRAMLYCILLCRMKVVVTVSASAAAATATTLTTKYLQNMFCKSNLYANDNMREKLGGLTAILHGHKMLIKLKRTSK